MCLDKFKDKEMTDLSWADEIEKLVLGGLELERAMDHVMKLRSEYNIYATTLAATKQHTNMDLETMILIHRQEVEELYQAFIKKDDKNFEEEVFDVLQTIINLCDFKNINMQDGLLKHKLKLESRGRIFKDIAAITIGGIL